MNKKNWREREKKRDRERKKQENEKNCNGYETGNLLITNRKWDSHMCKFIIEIGIYIFFFIQVCDDFVWMCVTPCVNVCLCLPLSLSLCILLWVDIIAECARMANGQKFICYVCSLFLSNVIWFVLLNSVRV